MYINSIKINIVTCLLLMFSAVTTVTAGNVWKMSDQTVEAGSQRTIELQLENTDEVVSFQFDITLPEGVLLSATPVLSADRTNEHVLNWKGKNNNTYRCVVYSVSNNVIKGNKGTLLSIPVQFTKSFNIGQLQLTQIVMANKKSDSLQATAEMGTLTVKSEKKKIVLNVSGLEQVVNNQEAAKVTLATLPVAVASSCKVSYYEDASFTKEANEEARKNVGIFYVKIERTEDETYFGVSENYVMSVNDKKQVNLTAPLKVVLTAGLPLSTAILSGGSATRVDETGILVPGSFVWTNSGTIVTESGKYSATFIPEDNMTYNSKEIEVEVEVLPTCFITIINPTVGGRILVKGRNDKDTYIKGQKLELKAIPDANYKFTGWTGQTGKDETLVITADGKDLTISAEFERESHLISFSQPASGGSLIVMDEAGKEVESGRSLPHGSIISIITQPNPDMKLDELKVNGSLLVTGKYKLDKPINSITAKFSNIPQSAFKLTVVEPVHGSIRLYKTDGTMISSESSLPINTEFMVITLPNNGYRLSSLAVEGDKKPVSPVEGIYKVTGNMSVSADFTEMEYEVKAVVKGAGTLELDKSGKCKYGTFVTIKKADEDSCRLVRIVANGKEVHVGETLKVTGNLTVMALFEKRVDINPDYIISEPQKYVYNGISHDFIAYATQTYAYYSFDVKYKKGGQKFNNAIDAGEYDVIVSRNEDDLYNKFECTYPKKLIIDKSSILVTKAPTTNDDGNTRPSNDVVVSRTEKDPLIMITYTPGSSIINNYNSTTYYLSKSDNKVALNFSNASILRGTTTDGVQGYVRVTNGNLPYSEEELAEIPEGTTVMAEVIPANGYKFVKWSDENKDINRRIIVGSDNMNFNPKFEPKDTLNVALKSNETTYTGKSQVVELSGLPKDIKNCIISFYSDQACTQSAEMKNCGTYWVRIYRPEDDNYKELNAVLSYTITPASLERLDPPAASDVVIGESLSQSELSGGNAGIVAGVFQWENSTVKVENESNTFTAKFIPTDPNYKEQTVPIPVKGIPVTKSTGTNPNPGPDPEDPDNGGEEVPETPVDDPVVSSREAEAAIITWNKVGQAASYKLNLYNNKNKAVLLQTLNFDKEGNLLRSTVISFRLTGLKANQTYYIETIAYNDKGKEIAKKGLELPAAITTNIESIEKQTLLYVDNRTLHIYLTKPTNVAVFKLNGERVFHEANVCGNRDVALEQSGLYIVVFRTDNDQYVKKIIVK